MGSPKVLPERPKEIVKPTTKAVTPALPLNPAPKQAARKENQVKSETSSTTASPLSKNEAITTQQASESSPATVGQDGNTDLKPKPTTFEPTTLKEQASKDKSVSSGAKAVVTQTGDKNDTQTEVESSTTKPKPKASLPEPIPIDSQSKEEIPIEYDKNSTPKTSFAPRQPLIVDSSAKPQRQTPVIFEAGHASTANMRTTEGEPYNFQAPIERDDLSITSFPGALEGGGPFIVNMGSPDELIQVPVNLPPAPTELIQVPMSLVSPPNEFVQAPIDMNLLENATLPAPQAQMVAQQQGQWVQNMPNQVPQYVAMMPAHANVTNFSVAAPVFTPANETPPYSLSSTPVIPQAGAPSIVDYVPTMGMVQGYGPVPNFQNVHGAQHVHVQHVQQAQAFHGNQQNYDQRQQRRPARYRHRQSQGHGGSQGTGGHHFHPQAQEFTPIRAPMVVSYQDFNAGIVDHITGLYDSATFADWRFIVENADKSGDPTIIPVHGSIISRNHNIRQRMESIIGQQSQRASKDMFFVWNDTFIHPSSFHMAVRYLYNEVLFTKDDVIRVTYPGESNASWRQLQMHWALSYFLSGRLLGINAVTTRGRELVSEFIDWDSLETAIHWASDFIQKDNSSTNDGMSTGMSRTTSTISTPSNAANAQGSRDDVPAPIISQETADIIMAIVIQFLVANVSFESFVIDTAVRTTDLKPRCPVTREVSSGLRPAPNHVVRTIAFGDFPTTAVAANDPVYHSYTASVAFLNMPFERLGELLAVMRSRNDPRAFEFAKQIVASRENVRMASLRSKSVVLAEREKKLIDWNEAGWQEVIVEHPANTVNANQQAGHQTAPTQPEWSLERFWQGIENPNPGSASNTRPPNFRRRRDQRSGQVYPRPSVDQPGPSHSSDTGTSNTETPQQ